MCFILFLVYVCGCTYKYKRVCVCLCNFLCKREKYVSILHTLSVSASTQYCHKGQGKHKKVFS
ncbi:hypothetical protein EON63_04890 [archaeon]|nr:MAG: hypothetical protein EON63_04890 [archaeon]